MKNSLLKIYTLVTGIILAGTLVYFGGGLTYEYFQNNLNSATINFYAKISFCIVLFFTSLTLVMICLVAKNGIVDDSADVPESDGPVTDEEIGLEEELVEENQAEEELSNEEDNALEPEEIFEEDQVTSEVIESDVIGDELPVEETQVSEDETDIIEDSPSEPEIDFDEASEPYDNFGDSELDMDDIEIDEEFDSEEEELLDDIIDDMMDDSDFDEKAEMPELMTPDIPKPVADQSTNFDGTQAHGLYNEETGICWESYLKTRLDNELIRASASEYDLVCYVFCLENIGRSSEKGKKICSLLADEFQFKDLVFEYKDDCIVAVKTNYSIDDAINYGEKLYNSIEGMLDEGENLYIGISSRTIRMVSADRLLKEAEQAMFHAIEDEDSNIIAFRANAEKYMEMMNK